LIKARAAANSLLVALGALALFHVLMLLRVLPAGVAWGGRAGDSPGSLVVLEAVGLLVSGLFALIVAAKIGYLKGRGLGQIARIGTWVVFGYFVLNILGNIASTSPAQRVLFAPVSVLLALLALRLAVEK
jgi:hypothetical protein